MNIRKIPLNEIRVTQTRQREDLGDVKALAESLKQFGQLQPIIVDANNELVAGFRRYTAAQALNWPDIAAVYRDDIDDLMYRELELEENIQRKDMTWLEKSRAVAEIDRIKRIRTGGAWGQTQTAAMTGLNQAYVSKHVNIAKMVELFPEIAEAKSLNQALSWAKHKAATVERTLDVKESGSKYESIEDSIVLGDSIEVIKQIPDGTFNAVITDPPFGLDYDSRKSNKAGVETAYEDSPETYERLLGMAPDIYRVLKPNGWCVWFFGMSWYPRVVETFEDAGFIVDPLPIIWDRSKGKCHTNRPDRYFARGYDVALHCIKGDPQMVLRGKPNIIPVEPVGVNERDLLVERPVDLYAELIRRLTLPGEYIADFFVGSGSCPAAAASLGRRYFGVELNPERRLVAIQKIYNHTPKITATP